MAVHHELNSNHHHHHHRHHQQAGFDAGAGLGTNNNNPYALFRVCCTSLYTKDHAQLCGVVSFSLFLCLVVISLMFFGSLSIFYIVSGVIVYSLLMKSLFGLAEKSYVLFYLLFEAVQIGFHLALILYYLLPVIFSQLPSKQCEYVWTIVNGTRAGASVTCKEFNLQQEYMELLLFILILVSVKLYFARVFAHFYKYLVWNDKFVMHTAQYINGRGVQISAIFPPPPPTFWDIPGQSNDATGYSSSSADYQQNQQRINVSRFLPAAMLPSYVQACQQKPPTMGAPPASTVTDANQQQQQQQHQIANAANTSGGNAVDVSSPTSSNNIVVENGNGSSMMKLNLHV